MKIREYIFGETIVQKENWNSESIRKLILMGREKESLLNAYPVCSIINLLHRTGILWSDKNGLYYKKSLEFLVEYGMSPEMANLSLELIPEILNSDSLIKRLKMSLPYPMEVLDNWYKPAGFEGQIRGLPKGVSFHISAGNIFLGAIDSLVMGLLTKNINILKLSRNDPLGPLLFAESIKSVDSDKVVSSSFSIIHWKGGNIDVEKSIAAHADSILVWGGEKAVQNYKNMGGLGTRITAFGPKISFGVISKQGLEFYGVKKTAEKLAKDVSLWDQSACSSPQNIFIESSIDEKLVDSLITELSAELDKTAVSLPRSKMDLDTQAEITKQREFYRFKSAQGDSRISYSKNNHNYSIVYDRTEDITSSPLGRFIIIKPYKTVMKLKKIIRNCWHYLQSCGLLVSPSEFSMYRTGLTDSGVNRCCECGKMLNVVDGAPHDSILPLNELIRWVHSETSFFTAPDRDVIQNHLKFIYGHNELYKKLWKDVDLDQTGSTCRTGRTCCADVIQSLPVLTKKIFYENSPPKKNSIITESLLEAPLIFASGGSTGNPKFSYFTDSEFNTIASALADNYILNGIIKSDKIANLFMAGFLWSSFICVDRAINIIGATNIPIGGQTEIDTIIKYLEIFKPTVIMGLPSQLVEIARIMQKRKIELNVRTVFYAGEQMNDSIMSQLQNSWNVSNFKSAGYASVDAGPIGYQCKEQDKGIHHLYSNMQIIEILEFDSDKKVSDGETGEITITNIFRKLMPFIRYRTGDQGYILKDQKCLCGRNDKVFKLIGRCDDRLLAGGARMNIHEIEPLILKYKLLTSAYQFQVSIKNSNDHLKLLLETDNINEAEKITDRFISEFMEIFKDFAFSVEKKWIEPLELEFLTPNEIKRVERTGKLKLIDDQRIL